MKEEITEKVDKEIKKFNLHVDDVYFSEEEKVKNLNIVLDSEEVIDIEKITEASKVINDIIDEMDIEEENYVLDIHSKEKGSVEDE